jgi:hypothetical protein
MRRFLSIYGKIDSHFSFETVLELLFPDNIKRTAMSFYQTQCCTAFIGMGQHSGSWLLLTRPALQNMRLGHSFSEQMFLSADF